MTLYYEITARVVYKLWVLPVNKSAFSIASPVRFTYLAVNTGAISLSVCPLLKQRPAPGGTADCDREPEMGVRWQLNQRQPISQQGRGSDRNR